MKKDLRISKDWLLTAERAAIHVPTRTAVVADLHLGYDEARINAGEAIPACELDDVLAHFSTIVHRHMPRAFVFAGDIVESAGATGHLNQLLAWLCDQEITRIVLVLGNHDVGLVTTASDSITVCTDFQLGEWLIVHGHNRLPAGKVVMGHAHPALRLRPGLKLPCYLFSDSRIVLPAFSRDAAGDNVLRKEEWNGYGCAAIMDDGVVELGNVSELKRVLRSTARY